MSDYTVAIKVDVDTFIGSRDGVPRLLEIFHQFGIRASFFFSLGPDNSGKAIRRIFTRKGFLAKMLRTRAPAMYGLRTMLYGTLLPAPMIGSSCREIIRQTGQQGHETGIHCWDHVHWHDHLPNLSREETAAELEKAGRLYRDITGQAARSVAAPGWTVSAASLAVQDSMGLLYASDSRGVTPFFPEFQGQRFTTLQIPTTLPTMDELLGSDGITAATINDFYLARLAPGLTVHTIHAELEGMAMAPVFCQLLERLSARGVRCVTLAEAAAEALQGLPPVHFMNMGELPGRAGLVALQQT